MRDAPRRVTRLVDWWSFAEIGLGIFKLLFNLFDLFSIITLILLLDPICSLPSTSTKL